MKNNLTVGPVEFLSGIIQRVRREVVHTNYSSERNPIAIFITDGFRDLLVGDPVFTSELYKNELLDLSDNHVGLFQTIRVFITPYINCDVKIIDNHGKQWDGIFGGGR